MLASPGLFEISDEVSFPAAHQLRFTTGEGEFLHGHTWRVRAFVRSETLDRRGMVVDFADLHAALVGITAGLSHRFLNEVPPFDDVNPSAENLARHFAVELGRVVGDERVRVHRVDVWETDTCCATWFAE